MSSKQEPEKQVVRTRTPRPDELTAETLEFLTEVDRFKRDNMQSILSDHEVLQLLLELGYREGKRKPTAKVDDAQVGRYLKARKVYTKATGRLFPSWSEVFTILQEIGYARPGDSSKG